MYIFNFICILIIQLLEIGVTGHHGCHAVKRAEMERRHVRVCATIQVPNLEAMTVMVMTPRVLLATQVLVQVRIL